ncbi:hypothetical protein PR002_g22178 [Phytophthora rubi]|uniref:Uncharacterized protein n=1 Tax=Phytophthora rubi TaxID=129364 RepID=A0A6A3J0T2_9STRA|nr:hypothetical protein PR002_g22178 [Phytophthora rubi]
MEQRMVDPRLLKTVKYLETWRVLSQGEQALVKKLSAALTALDSEETLMEATIATLDSFMTEMRSVGMTARDVALAETMARRLTAGKSALVTAERAVVDAQTKVDAVDPICSLLCALVARLLPQLPVGQWLPHPNELQMVIADMHQKQAGIVESIQEMRAALTLMEGLTVEARAMTFGP